MKNWILKFSVFACLILPRFASAQLGGIYENCDVSDPQVESFGCMLENGINLLLTIASPILVIMIMIGGVMYITSAGNQSKAEAGKKTLVGAFIGLIIVVLAKFLVSLVANII